MTTKDKQKGATDIEIIDFTPSNIADYEVCGYKDVENQPPSNQQYEI